jgi:hypothetical protein
MGRWRRAEKHVDVRVKWSLLFDFHKQLEGTGKIIPTTTTTNAKFHENPWSCSRPYVAELADVYSSLNLLLLNSPCTPLVCESQETKPKPNLQLRMEGSELYCNMCICYLETPRYILIYANQQRVQQRTEMGPKCRAVKGDRQWGSSAQHVDATSDNGSQPTVFTRLVEHHATCCY